MERATERFTLRFRQSLERLVEIHTGKMHYGVYSAWQKKLIDVHNTTMSTGVWLPTDSTPVQFNFKVSYFEMETNIYLIIYDVSLQTEREIICQLEQRMETQSIA